MLGEARTILLASFGGELSDAPRVSFKDSKTGRLWYAHVGRKAGKEILDEHNIKAGKPTGDCRGHDGLPF